VSTPGIVRGLQNVPGALDTSAKRLGIPAAVMTSQKRIDPVSLYETAAQDMDRDFTKDAWSIDQSHRAFLARFKRENGRAPRVLNIGNIANNAFKNAAILRKNGIECDVICYDYYHVMGCPEWELASFSTEDINFDAPTWQQIDLGGYERPRWFAQGRFLTCIDYLLAQKGGGPEADRLWHCLVSERDSGGGVFPDSSLPAAYDAIGVRKESERLAALFEATFPERDSKPSAARIASQFGGYINEIHRLRRLFALYDLVVGYATDGLLPLIARKTPYACFEHGTIRTFPFDGTLFGQMCALSYAHADDVLITNCDNIVAARRLGLRSFRFLPHAMLEDFRVDPAVAGLRDELLKRHDADFIVFHPSRQHWSLAEDLNWEKGNDRLIRAFARFQREDRPKALLIMVAWGQMVAASRNLVAELGIGDRVVWLSPQPMPLLGRYVAVADVLADQFVIGAWGAIMPHGMMLGTPTMLYLNETLHEWCFPEMPPVLNARTEDEVYVGLVKATDPAYRERIKVDGVNWYDRFHSEAVVATRLVSGLMRSLHPEPVNLLLRGQRGIQAQLLLQQHPPKSGWLSTVVSKLERAGRQALGSDLTLRARRSIRSLQARRPILGGFVFHVLYWPIRAAIWVARKIVKLGSG